MDRDEMSTCYRGPPIDASYQVSVHLAKRFQRRRFLINLYRDNCILNTDIYIYTRVIFLLTEEKIFQKSTNHQKQELPVATMFGNQSGKNEQSLQRTFHRCFLPSFSSFGKAVSEEKIFQKSTNQKQEWPVAAMFVNGLGQNEHSLQRTFHNCFLPSFGSFGYVVLEEKIKM